MHPFFEYLKQHELLDNVTYVPIDISESMLKLATKNISKTFGVYVEPHRLDFESGNFSDITFELRKKGTPNLLVFLGGTLGNQPDMSRVLSNFRDSMTTDDYLLVGAELVNLYRIENLIQSQYAVRIVYDLVFTPLEYCGVRQDQGKFKVLFDKELAQIESYFSPTEDISFEIGGERIEFYRNEDILLYKSTKFSDWALAKLFSNVGYRFDVFSSARANNYALMLCQPSRFTF